MALLMQQKRSTLRQFLFGLNQYEIVCVFAFSEISCSHVFTECRKGFKHNVQSPFVLKRIVPFKTWQEH